MYVLHYNSYLRWQLFVYKSKGKRCWLVSFLSYIESTDEISLFKVGQSFLIYRDSDISKESLLLDESRILKFLMLTVCGSKRRINHAIQVFSIRLGCTFHYDIELLCYTCQKYPSAIVLTIYR